MNKLTKIDQVIITFLVATVFFLRYIKPLYPEWYLIDLMILIYVFFRMFNSKVGVNFGVVMSFYVLVLIIAINIINFGFGINVIENLLMIFMPLTILVYMIYLKKSYEFITLNLMALKFTKFLNIYFFINSAIITVQILTESFMMERFIVLNPLIVDHMTGFIGLSGGNILNFLWILTILFNLYFYLESKSILRLLMLICEIIIMTLLSVANDNKMFVVTLLVNIIMFLFVQIVKSGIQSVIMKRIIKIAVVAMVVFVALYKLSEDVSEGIENVIHLVSNFFGAEYPDHHNERAYLNYLAFHIYNADSLGIGINSVDLNNQSIHPHLGINSATFILIQGGLLYYISIVNFYSLIILELMAVRGAMKKIMLYVSIFLTILVASYAAQPFRDHYLFIMLSLIYFVCYLSLNTTVHQKIKVEQNCHMNN
ncbi:hypothetical protein [Bacillus paranthracis]|uniref:hypothetical protein n=1 Tax=Bacillus paranthracis TaxID=2026186 RepID=UPI0021CF0D53|nr:hypothetical protein [Bacillus paranthracis]MCU5174422.1 hypothetical protein [Bacillus paranthracis]